MKRSQKKKKDAGVNTFKANLIEGDNCCHKSIYCVFSIYISIKIVDLMAPAGHLLCFD